MLNRSHLTLLQGLKLGPFMSEDVAGVAEDPNYDLYAVSNHYGNLVGGHYSVYCLSNAPEGGKKQWLCLNDETVTRQTKDQIVTAAAYMLFYCQRKE